MNHDQMRDDAWNYMTETGIATEDELKLVTCINGFSIETLESILFARTGYRSVEQIRDMEDN